MSNPGRSHVVAAVTARTLRPSHRKLALHTTALGRMRAQYRGLFVPRAAAMLVLHLPALSFFTPSLATYLLRPATKAGHHSLHAHRESARVDSYSFPTREIAHASPAECTSPGCGIRKQQMEYNEAVQKKAVHI
ncbi:hypothetical protein MRX96_034321 [Rhipicephalus microplus]